MKLAWLIPAADITDQDRERLEKMMGNYGAWSKAKDTITTEEDALKLLALEVVGRHRPLMIERFKHKFNVLRHQREMHELYTSPLFREGYRKVPDQGSGEAELPVPKVHKPGKNRRARQAPAVP